MTTIGIDSNAGLFGFGATKSTQAHILFDNAAFVAALPVGEKFTEIGFYAYATGQQWEVGIYDITNGSNGAALLTSVTLNSAAAGTRVVQAIAPIGTAGKTYAIGFRPVSATAQGYRTSLNNGGSLSNTLSDSALDAVFSDSGTNDSQKWAFFANTSAVATNAINTVNNGNPLVYGEPATLALTGFATAINAADIAGVSCSNVSNAGFTPPALTDGATVPMPGEKTFTVSNGTDTDSKTVVIGVADQFNAVLLTAPDSSSAGSCLKGFNPAAKNGDYIVYPNAANTQVDGEGIVSTDSAEQMQFIHLSVDDNNPLIGVAYTFTVQVSNGEVIVKNYKVTAVFAVAHKVTAVKALANFC